MYHKKKEEINSFAEISSHDFFQQLTESVRKEIKQERKEKILQVDESDYKNYLISKYGLEPIEIINDQKIVNKSTKETRYFDDSFGRRIPQEIYSFKVTYPFRGTPSLFRVAPSSRTLSSSKIEVNHNNNTVSFNVLINNKDAKMFQKREQKIFHDAFVNIKNINPEAERWTKNLPGLVNRFFDSIKKDYLDENKFFEEINVKTDDETELIFSVPEIKKKIVPKPSVKDDKKFSSEPTMAQEMYNDILEVIYAGGKKMERKPSMYQGKSEEDIRDQFLFLLETRYESTTATGETFNKKGKTDILLKYSDDGSNLFVAECKYWSGSKELSGAINQLFDRYLTWRDSKAAIILFVNNKNFTNVIEQVDGSVGKHEYFLQKKGKRGETSFSYIFHLPEDKEKKVYLEVMLFHFPNN